MNASADRIEALHTAARRYCFDRAAQWSARYDELLAAKEQGRRHSGLLEPIELAYTDEELATFPRYQVLHAIQAEIEAFVPSDFASLEEARELLAEAGLSAESLFTRPPTGEIEREAMAGERRLFAAYVREFPEEKLSTVETLSYRRTLTEDERRRILTQLRQRWGVDGYWYPLDRPLGDDPPPFAHAFDAEPFFDPGLQRVLRDVVGALGVTRLWEVRELESERDNELELSLFDPVYNGSEGFWTARSFDWLVYASHESSVTIAGAELLPALQRAWPAWSEFSYVGWDA